MTKSSDAATKDPVSCSEDLAQLKKKLKKNIHKNECKNACEGCYKIADRGMEECITERCDLYRVQKRFPEEVVFELRIERYDRS